MKIRLKYCGGCNTVINREKLADEVLNYLKTKDKVEITRDEADVALIICGCPVGCVDIADIKNHTGKLIMVSGTNVNYLHVPPDQMVNHIGRLILEDRYNR
ncbi:MAG TPA: hypothetical protein DER33_08875 [Syntrophomonas sp.]|jgi:metal-dependent amidase/aminoacylase/carboxypeptidase family protein|nr:hypothetical protein [Syntrophomonas sp.]HCF71675.1 hypothetical protein [Syntrophomonas sp.]